MNQQEIQLFVPSFRTDECLEQIKECLDMGWTGSGFKTIEFENKWKDYTGHPHAYYLNSATSGLNLALEILKEENSWTDDAEVITTPLTFVSTNHAILINGLRPVFADVDEFMCLDPEDIVRKITPLTKALIFVGLGGNTGQYTKVLEICRRHNIKVVLDAAHMCGTLLNGRWPGLDADVAVYSYQSVKNLPTGDSGMICFTLTNFDMIARKKSWLGINKDTYSRTLTKSTYNWEYDVEYVGHKYQGNSIMASIGLVQIKYLDEDNAYRRQICEWYDEGFVDETAVNVVKTAPGCLSSRHLYQILVRDRDPLLIKLNKCGVYAGVHYRDNTDYKMYAFGKGACPKASQHSKQLLSLPLHLRLTQSDVHYIIDVVKKNVK